MYPSSQLSAVYDAQQPLLRTSCLGRTVVLPGWTNSAPVGSTTVTTSTESSCHEAVASAPSECEKTSMSSTGTLVRVRVS